jgi:hypothetical protein
MHFQTANPLAPSYGISPRLAMMEQVEPSLGTLGADTPSYAVIRFGELVELTRADESQSISYTHELDEAVRRATSRIESDQVFVRLCALQDLNHRHLSFAGVFATAMPRRSVPRRVHLSEGVKEVLAGRFSDYANYYYGRHGLGSVRAADVMFSGCVEDAAMCGTAYIYGDTVLAAYFDSPLSIALHDPVRFLNRGAALRGVDAQVARCVRGLQELLNTPLDVEFIVTRGERLYITEVRPISEAHLRNWKRVSEDTWRSVSDEGPPGNVVNTPGVRSGEVVDLRQRQIEPPDFDGANSRIYVVRHQPTRGGTSSFDFLTHAHTSRLSDLAVIVDHGRGRRDDHLQYVMFEDPGLAFCVHASAIPSDLPPAVVVHSDGFRVRFA